MHVGADYRGGVCSFSVWAPYLDEISLLLTQENQRLKMDKTQDDYFGLAVNGIKPNAEFLYQLNAKTTKPDPASHYQPNGVFGASAVVHNLKLYNKLRLDHFRGYVAYWQVPGSAKTTKN